jgi:hypothetical protein
MVFVAVILLGRPPSPFVESVFNNICRFLCRFTVCCVGFCDSGQSFLIAAVLLQLRRSERRSSSISVNKFEGKYVKNSSCSSPLFHPRATRTVRVDQPEILNNRNCKLCGRDSGTRRQQDYKTHLTHSSNSSGTTDHILQRHNKFRVRFLLAACCTASSLQGCPSTPAGSGNLCTV